ncbi:MAG: hypothetical protein P5702_01485 [Limnospira sp. PMC 1291.21]|uniref:hypothetical protein n=1 Tax=unclassified Limnospira TaxID=2642885 RepID=UPI0028E0DEB8|nr:MULTISPECIES: hypothetical protein [unclassified Limnospira]MDT9191531.1 hypothetical protein [Limnospira sp. PMC 1245.20]MDT9201774.1 hypothetical protein [Limnospira sp. PMC 1243.20]MDT9237483.1 hypothetical protein [Limnospira sp. PMC 1261.20]MDT9242487.1 hypothetical protein [Limnospira sp. PMC 1249.20]MDT9257907.1 hypothetical protein [Limnospira sp. PMC 1236.20]
MDTQKIINNPESNREDNQVSIQEQFHQEIEQTPDEILAIALEFLLFMRSRASDSSTAKTTKDASETSNKLSQLPYRQASGKSLVDYQGEWVGDDFEECLRLVLDSRSQVNLSNHQPF